MDSSNEKSSVDANAGLARFCAEDGLTALGADGWLAAQRQIVDTVAVGWAGSDADGVTQAAGIARDAGGAPVARLWGRPERATAAQAAFVNAVAAAALDYDCVHQGSLLHPAAITVPVALALAEEHAVSGEKIVEAHIVGSEVMERISLATPRQSNFFPASLYGVFGAAATASRILGLDAEQTLNAFGLALAQASGTKQAIAERTLAKRLQTAFAVRAGIMAADLARRGVTGPKRFLDGVAGLFSLYESGEPGAVIDGIGRTFVFDQAVIKKYPSCLCTHVVIDAVCRLRDANRIVPNDVQSIDTIITPYMSRLIGAPYAPGDDPQVAAQFSAAYTAACALETGGVTLADIAPERATDPDRVRRAQAVTVTTFDDRDGHVAPTTVSITMKSGETHTLHVEEVPNGAVGDNADADLWRKSSDCFGRGAAPLGDAEARRLFDGLLTLRQAPGVDAVFG